MQQLKWPHRKFDVEDAFLEADLHILLFQSAGRTEEGLRDKQGCLGAWVVPSGYALTVTRDETSYRGDWGDRVNRV